MPPVQTPLTLRNSPIRWIVGWGLRGGLAGFIIWLCGWTLQGLSAFLQPASATQAEVASTNHPIGMLHDSMLAEGGWQFPDSAVDLQAELLIHATARQRLLTPPNRKSRIDPRVAHQFAGLLSLLRRQGRSTKVWNHQRWEINAGGINVAAFVRNDGTDSLEVIRWLLPIGDDRCWLIEQSAAQVNASSSLGAIPILPRSISSDVLAQRTDAAGNVTCQLLRSTLPLSDVMHELRRGDWRVEATPHQDGSACVTLVVTHGTTSYWMVTSAHPNTTATRILLLRTPANVSGPQS